MRGSSSSLSPAQLEALREARLRSATVPTVTARILAERGLVTACRRVDGQSGSVVRATPAGVRELR